jgi:hypothetical protein
MRVWGSRCTARAAAAVCRVESFPDSIVQRTRRRRRRRAAAGRDSAWREDLMRGDSSPAHPPHLLHPWPRQRLRAVARLRRRGASGVPCCTLRTHAHSAGSWARTSGSTANPPTCTPSLALAALRTLCPRPPRKCGPTAAAAALHGRSLRPVGAGGAGRRRRWRRHAVDTRACLLWGCSLQRRCGRRHAVPRRHARRARDRGRCDQLPQQGRGLAAVDQVRARATGRGFQPVAFAFCGR